METATLKWEYGTSYDIATRAIYSLIGYFAIALIVEVATYLGLNWSNLKERKMTKDHGPHEV